LIHCFYFVLSFCLQLLISKKEKTSFSRKAFFPCRWLSENFFFFLFYFIWVPIFAAVADHYSARMERNDILRQIEANELLVLNLRSNAGYLQFPFFVLFFFFGNDFRVKMRSVRVSFLTCIQGIRSERKGQKHWREVWSATPPSPLSIS
jgi:hypothetical protein